jgi:O-antigen/teichoic acid export membrane protein
MFNKKNIINYSLHILNGILPIILILYLNSKSTLTFMGYFFKALAVIGTVQLFVDYGFNYSAIRSYRELSTNDSTTQHRINFFYNLLVTKCLIGIVVFLAFICYTKIFLTQFVIADLSYVFFGIVFSLLNLNWFFYATDKSLEFNSILVILRIISFLILYILPLRLDSLLIINFAPYFLSNVLLISYLAYKQYPKKPIQLPKLEIFYMLKSGWTIFSNGIVISFLTMGWPIFLSMFLTVDMIGLYGLADRISRGLRNLIGPLPFLILSRHKQSSPGFNFQSFDQKYIKLFGLLLICVPLFFMLMPNFLLGIVLKGVVINYRLLLNLYALGFIAGALNSLFYTYLIKFTKESLYLIYFVLAYVLGVSLGLLIGTYIFMPLFVEFILCILLVIKFFLEYNKTKNIIVTFL